MKSQEFLKELGVSVPDGTEITPESLVTMRENLHKAIDTAMDKEYTIFLGIAAEADENAGPEATRPWAGMGTMNPAMVMAGLYTQNPQAFAETAAWLIMHSAMGGLAIAEPAGNA